jgi:hypothetical protein
VSGAAQHPDDDPVERLRAFLGVWLVPGRDAIERIHADRAYELRGSDIAAALKQLDEARSKLADIRTLVAKWAGPTAAGERILAGEILALTGGPWTEAKLPPLTPGLPGYACGICGSLFTPAGEPRDQHSRHADSPWCRGCVEQCHEGGDGHRCVICTPKGEGTLQ